MKRKRNGIIRNGTEKNLAKIRKRNFEHGTIKKRNKKNSLFSTNMRKRNVPHEIEDEIVRSSIIETNLELPSLLESMKLME